MKFIVVSTFWVLLCELEARAALRAILASYVYFRSFTQRGISLYEVEYLSHAGGLLGA